MSEFFVKPYREEAKSIWDGVVRASRNGNFLHLRSYMGYHVCRFDEQSLVIYKHEKPVAVLPCNRVKDQIVSHSGLTYAGLIFGNEVRATDVLSIFDQIAGYFRDLGCKSLTYKAIPHVFHRYPAEEDLYALFRLGARLTRRDLSTVVQVNNRIRWSDSRKNTIRKAEKLGLSVSEENFLESFHALLTRSLQRFGTKPVHSLEEMQLLKSRFPDQIRLVGAYKENKLLAGALIYDFGHVAHSQYLASSEEGKLFGALDLVLARLLDREFSQHQYFSFGVSTEHEGHYLNEGLVFQKEGFGGRAVVHDFYELEL